MRSDDVGLFWQDYQIKGKYAQDRPQPPIPMTGWTTPEAYPDLSNAPMIGIDTETYDPDLKELGPGAKRDGYIAGLAVSVPTGESWYFPMAHKLGGNLPPEHVLRWAKDNLTRPNQPKIGARILYDLEFLAEAGVDVAGPFHDVQIAEPLINELKVEYNLESILQDHLGLGKTDDDLYDWLSKAYGGPATRDSQAKNIWRAPVQMVGPYAEGDVKHLFAVHAKQQAIIEEQGLRDVYKIESGLTPLLLAMRRRGVRVNVEAASKFHEMATEEIKKLEHRIGNINVDSKDDLVRLCNKEGIEFPRTEKGNPSFVKNWLQNHPHPSLRLVTEIRSLYKLRDTFVQGYILDKNVNGRVYTQFNQLRGDEYGTVSGRFSSSTPNLQNVPTRTDLGKAIRAMFLAEHGHCWDRFDWSQIEFRLLTHYALGRGAEQARQMYRDDPTTDFHQMTCEMINKVVAIDRGPAKNINFGFVYGMGAPLLAAILGLSESAAEPILNGYHNAVPFVRRTFQAALKRAEQRGYIKTIRGRRRRFPEGMSTHKALNGLLQGGAGDIMKEAMVQCWEAGLFADDVLGAPLLTVHDELDVDNPMTPVALEATRELKHIMETCVPLSVPMYVDHERGPDWGHCVKVSKMPADYAWQTSH